MAGPWTDCETTVNPNACVIKEDKPQFLSVNDILEYDTWHTRDLLGARTQSVFFTAIIQNLEQSQNNKFLFDR